MKKSIGVDILAPIIGGVFIVIVVAITVINGTVYSVAEKEFPIDAQTSPKTETKMAIEKEIVLYRISTVEDSSLEYGKMETRVKGAMGEITYTYEITYVDGKEASRELISKETTRQPIDAVVAKGTKISWHCVDTTSYDGNPYNDNKCISNTGEVRYVSDSQSVALDPTYSPGKAGAYYYNNK